MITYIAFSHERKAVEFERYLKSASGRAFANKRLRQASKPLPKLKGDRAVQRDRLRGGRVCGRSATDRLDRVLLLIEELP